MYTIDASIWVNILVTSDNEQLTRLGGIITTQTPADAYLSLSSQTEKGGD